MSSTKPIYVRNQTSGDVTFDVEGRNGRYIVRVPDTNIPYDVTYQGAPAEIGESPWFRKSLTLGHITLVPTEEAERELQDPDAKEEMRRLLTNQENAIRSEPAGYAEIASEMESDEAKALALLNKPKNLQVAALREALEDDNGVSPEFLKHVADGAKAQKNKALLDLAMGRTDPVPDPDPEPQAPAPAAGPAVTPVPVPRPAAPRPAAGPVGA